MYYFLFYLQVKMSEFEKDLALLYSHAKLERDKGSLLLKSTITKLKNTDGSSIGIFKELENLLITFLESHIENGKWEEIFGNLQASKIILECHIQSDGFTDRLIPCALKFLEYEEFRVRIVSGEVLGTLCRIVNPNIYRKCEEILTGNIRKNLKRDIPSDKTSPKDANAIFHDTAGWKCLETSMKGLQSIIEGCDEHFAEFMNFQLLDLIFETLEHPNRFVRETGFYLCASLARFGVSSKANSNKDMANKLSERLRNGLADNWSQVRLAASVATRQFFQDLNNEDKKANFKLLLPPMCLNRYYLAEGVKLYNQESWRLILGTEGIAYVEFYIKDIVKYYVEQTLCDNHAVREAACHCMAELGSKIDRDSVRPYVSEILNALHVCFRDDSWPVRDTACVACGNFILSFPNECTDLLNDLYPLFFANLSDPIPSVRQGAAVALTNVAKAYEEKALVVIFERIKSGLKMLETQPATSERYESLEKGAGEYSVIKQLRDNDFELHSNQQMYSCGSLSPKMNRGGGCMDHSFKRPSEPWELADGCIYVISEMAHYEKAHTHVQSSMSLITDASHLKHYTHHLHLFETINKVLPVIAKGLGKRIFKQYLEGFFDMIFYSLMSENALTKLSATECLQSLSHLLGPNILKGRVEQYCSAYVNLLDRITTGAPMYEQLSGV